MGKKKAQPRSQKTFFKMHSSPMMHDHVWWYITSVGKECSILTVLHCCKPINLSRRMSNHRHPPPKISLVTATLALQMHLNAALR